MLRAFLSLLVLLALAGAARAAGDIDTCRDAQAEATARLTACESVIANDKISGKFRAAAFGVRGDALTKKRDYDGAIAAFSAAHDADPDNVNYVNSRGIAYMNKGDDEHALADYDLCLRMQPNFASAYSNRGLIFMRKSDLQRALEEFNSAIKYSSADAPSRYFRFSNRAHAQSLLKQYGAALADFSEAARINPDGAEVPAYRCITYTEMQRFNEALADRDAVLAKTPKASFVLASRANAYLAMGNLDAALKDYNEALKIVPNNIRAHAGRGRLYEKQGDPAAARLDYSQASTAQVGMVEIDAAIARRFAKERLAVLAPAVPAPPSPPPAKPAGAGPAAVSGDIDTCRNAQAEAAARLVACESVIADEKITGKSKAAAFSFRGNTLNKKRDYDGAIAAYSAAHDIDPENVGHINSRGIAYSNKGDDEHALADYDLCLQTHPNFADAFNNRGLIFMRKGDLQRAFDEFNQAVNLASNSSPTRYLHIFNRARVEGLQKKNEAALADYTDALKLRPDAALIPAYRCTTYTDMGKFDEALADCNAVLGKDPKSVFTLTSRANAYLGKGSLDAALNDYNAALKISPNDIRAHAGRGQLYEKRRDFGAARADYRSASAALTKYDEIDAAIARRIAREHLAALTAVLPPPAAVPAKPAPGAAAAPAGARKVALIVGNGAYKNAPPLDNPPRDARLIASTFRELGFATVTLASDLGRDKFFAALHEFGAAAEKSDWAVVYYAGHGMEIGGVNYLLPTDVKLAADRDAETQAVALEQVIAAVSGARKLRLVLLDACRDNPFEKTMKHTIALKLVSKGFSNIEPEAGFMVVYAAKHGENALDGDSANSPFATALARDIREPKVEVRKLFDIVRDDVWTATKHQQQPFTYGSPPGREDFYFVAGK